MMKKLTAPRSQSAALPHQRPVSLQRAFSPFIAPCGPSKPSTACRATAAAASELLPFPEDFKEAITQAQAATMAAIADGRQLVEVEFPSAGLAAVAGDAEGANEMTYSMQHLRQFCRVFTDRAGVVRVFFPDKSEMRVAKEGKKKDPAAGSWDIDAVWEQTNFQLDYLTKPSGLLDVGIDLSGFDPAARVKETDELLICAYPSFDPRELVAVDKVWQGAAKGQGRPMILFNAELDRLRNGYYPAIFYPKMARLSKEFVPLVEAAYYIHNFKGVGAGVLFRAYPGPWQVLVRTSEGMKVVHQQEERLGLREVALDILPAAIRRFTAEARS